MGSWWAYRVGCGEAGIHRPIVAGMAGKAKGNALPINILRKFIEGCQSIILSGGYEDDEDNGDEFTYTGAGGRDLSGNKR